MLGKGGVLMRSGRGSKLPRHCHPQFAMVVLLRLTACSTPLLIGLTTACFRHRRRPSCAPYQFPLKSYGFSGAETARKRFLLWKIEFSDTKIAPSPPYTPPGTIKPRKGFCSTIWHGRSASSFRHSAALLCDRLSSFLLYHVFARGAILQQKALAKWVDFWEFLCHFGAQ